MRSGRLSKEEWAYIEDHAELLSYQQIARELDRDPESIRNFIQTKLGRGIHGRENKGVFAANELKETPIWQLVKKKFTSDELDIFLYHYTNLFAQFNNDVTSTEQSQIIDVVQLEILLDRALTQQKSNQDTIADIENELVDMKRNRDRDPTRTEVLRQQLANARGAQEALTKDYKELLDRKTKLFDALKSTRKQRYDKMEQSKTSFATWLKAVMENKTMRRELGETMEKMRLAVENEQERLGAYHQYSDGVVDRPFLTPETVGEDD